VFFVIFVVDFDCFAALSFFVLQIKGLDLKMNNVIIKPMEIKENVKGLLVAFKKGKHSLIQISGDDFDIKEALLGIKKDFDPEAIEVFFPDDAEEAVKNIHMKNLFGNRLIIVYDVDSISVPFSKEIKDVVGYPDRLKPNVVVLIYQNNKKILKIEGSLTGKFKSVYDSDIPAWIKSLVENMGFSITEEAINILQFSCGTNREEIKKYLERVILSKEDKDKNIEEKDLRDIGFYRDDTIFKITNSVLDGKYREALRYFLEYSDSVPLFHFINRDTRCLLGIRAAIDGGENLKRLKLNSKFNMHPYIFYKKYVPAAKRLSYEILESNYEKIMETEYKMKNGWEESSLNFNFLSQLQLGGRDE
jgi:DNA polymerase III delta subunit